MSDDAKKAHAPAKLAPAPDAWTKWVALSTTILAVCAAFATLKGGSYSTQTQLATVNATNRWSHFQSKSLKETARETERAIIRTIETGATSQEAKSAAAKAIDEASREIARYKDEKNQIKQEAETLDNLAKYCQKRGGYFGLAIMFLQISIMLSAIATLLKKKFSWILGLVLGTVGIGFLLYAWPLYETLVSPPPAISAPASK